MRNSFSCVTKTLISFVCRSLGIILLKAVWACRMKIIPSPPTESLWWQMWWQFLWKIELMNEIGSYDPMTSPLWYERLCEILPSGVILPKDGHYDPHPCSQQMQLWLLGGMSPNSKYLSSRKASVGQSLDTFTAKASVTTALKGWYG